MNAPSPEQQRNITARIRIGLAPIQAAVSCGVSKNEYEDWIRAGEAGGQGRAKYINFVKAVREAEAESETQLIAYIRNAASNGNWQAAAWLAERRFGERWLRKSVNETDKPAGAPSGDSDPFSGLDNVESITRRRRKK